MSRAGFVSRTYVGKAAQNEVACFSEFQASTSTQLGGGTAGTLKIPNDELKQLESRSFIKVLIMAPRSVFLLS
jgi:hypothetical protein